MDRRRFIKLSAATAIGAAPVAVVGYTLAIEPHWLEIVRRPLVVANLPAALRGRTLVQLSDLHVGPQVDDDYLIDSLNRVRDLAPDIVALTGDYISYEALRGESQFAQLRAVLTHLPRGRLATVGILGNHDYGVNWSEPRVAERIVAELERAGVQVLRNGSTTIAGLDIIGVDDLWARQSDTRKALDNRGSSASIALCHNPDAQDVLDWGDYAGWVLAGHTHGGQCKAPFLPPPLLPVNNPRYARGEVQVNARRTLYISRGLGHLIQARFNVRPEVTVFELT